MDLSFPFPHHAHVCSMWDIIWFLHHVDVWSVWTQTGCGFLYQLLWLIFLHTWLCFCIQWVHSITHIYLFYMHVDYIWGHSVQCICIPPLLSSISKPLFQLILLYTFNFKVKMYPCSVPDSCYGYFTSQNNILSRLMVHYSILNMWQWWCWLL